jgi:hypothetical protein
MIVSSPLFEAYLECSTKCWLRSRAEPKTPNAYAEWASLQNETYYQDRIKCLLEMFPESDRVIAPSISKHAKDAWRIATDVHLRMNGLETYLQAVERRPSEARGRPAQFIPYRFRFANKLTKKTKCRLRSTRTYSPKRLDAR